MIEMSFVYVYTLININVRKLKSFNIEHSIIFQMLLKIVTFTSYNLLTETI